MNSRPALRVDDAGVHAACCGPNTWKAAQGAPTVFINNKSAFRITDPSKHCGGMGQLIEGSSDVIVGDSGGGGGGGGSSSSNRSAGGGGAARAASSSSSSSSSPSPSSSPAPASSSPSSETTPASHDARSADDRPVAPPATAPANPDPDPPADPELTWIEIELVGEDGGPVAGEHYVITTPDGARHDGFLDDKGRAKLDAIKPGTCKISFPDIDAKAWDPI